MKRAFNILVLISALTVVLNGQKVPTGNPKDFKVKNCLHSVSYMGVWRGQATLSVDEHLQTNYVKLESQMRAVPMGTGFLDYKTFISTLKEIGYQGYIAYEMCEVLEGGGLIENLDKCAKTFLEYIKQFK